MASVETHMNSCFEVHMIHKLYIYKSNKKSKIKNTTESTLDCLFSGNTLVLLQQIYAAPKFENTTI